MKYKYIYLGLLMLIKPTIHCEINKMDEFIVKEEKNYRTIDCNLLIALNQTAELCGTETYYLKKIKLSSVDKTNLRCYIIDINRSQTEITNKDGIYTFKDIYKNCTLKLNQPDYNIYAVLENNKNNKEINIANCIAYYNELITAIKNIKKNENALSFLNLISITDKKTKADELVLVSENTPYLSILQNKIGGVLKNNTLRINKNLLNQTDQHFLSDKIDVFFPWRSDTDLPLIVAQSVYYPVHTFENKLIGKKSRILIPVISNN